MDKTTLDKISSNLDYKKILELLLKQEENEKNIGTYLLSRGLVKEEKIKECLNNEEFMLSFFKTYIKRLMSLSNNKTIDERLKKDIELINNSFILKNSKNIMEIFSSEDYKKLNIKPIFLQNLNLKSRFVHVLGSYLSDFKIENIECRLYLSPKMEYIMELCREIVNKHNLNSVPCYFKYNTNYEDNDRIVLYSELSNVEKHLKIFEEIKQEKPYLFEEMNKNPLWGNIDNVSDIYIGMEPHVCASNLSYGALRGMVFDIAFFELKRKYKKIDLSDEIVDEFKKLLDVYFLMYNINPDNIVLNMNNNRKENPITLIYDGVQIPIYVHYINSEKEVVRISTSVMTSSNDLFGIDSINWTPHAALDISFPELKLLYKHDINDPKYDESEEVRKRIYQEIKSIQEQQELEKEECSKKR